MPVEDFGNVYQVRFADKLGDVVPGRNTDLDGVGGTLVCIVMMEPLAQTVRFYPDNGISFLIEVGWSPESFDGDVVFLDGVRLTLKVALAYVLKKRGETGGSGENAGTEKGLELRALFFKLCCGLHFVGAVTPLPLDSAGSISRRPPF